ncbi:hypothetical protein WJX84_002593 [Apatococcus fuscideae]|uniref:TIP41-like protein n=1 Tax=Apatococcus fuscideae TaxID=2026836 RepID=A0AAW1TEF8_9CHLO
MTSSEDPALVHCGWKVEAFTRPITSDKDMDVIKAQLQVMSLPEQLFGGNSLQLRHAEHDLKLSFSAFPALAEWQQESLPPLQVSSAEQWSQSRELDIKTHQPLRFEYDWTFTTPYRGTLSSSAPDASSSGQGRLGWKESSQRIDKGMLMSRDPILFYAEVPLYVSELDDNGASQLSVKVRVMPKCWFTLLRFWLRVDQTLVRLRETRFFCNTSLPETEACIIRETTHSEGTFAELQAAGAPPEGPAYADADSAAAALQAVAPIGLKLLQIEKLLLHHPTG